MASKKNNAVTKPLSLSDKIWSELTGVLLVLAGIFLVAAMVSYNLGATEAGRNIGGVLGSGISFSFFEVLGLLGYILPLLLIVVGVNLIRLAPGRAHLMALLTILVFGIWLVIGSGYLLGSTALLHTTAAGSAGAGLKSALVGVIGHAGTIIFLIAYGLVLLVVFTPVRNHLGDWLRGLLAAIRKLFTRPITPEKPKLITPARLRKAEPLTLKPEPAQTELELADEEGSGGRGARGSGEPEPRNPGTPEPRGIAPLPMSAAYSFDQNDFLNLLYQPTEKDIPVKDEAEAQQEAATVLGKLREFGVDGTMGNIYSGPMITRFEFTPAPGVKIQRVENLSDDLALSLKAERIRILAPIPGKSAVGIEVPNRDRKMVYLREVLTSGAFQGPMSPLGFALGETITGEPYCADLSTMPHVLIAGTTGSGKSVCINTMVSSIIFRSSYQDVRFLTIDPKRLELPIYDPIPHLLFPTTVNSKEAVQKLDYVIDIMEMRYRDFARKNARDIAGYNEKAARDGFLKKPYIVVIIDELADLMITAPSEIEEKITRLAQMSRAVGIHLVLATQRPSVDVITGLIKANFPCRIAFQVASKTDSRTILDMNGAESLLGRGDMLFLPPGKGEPLRLHGAFISADETQKIVRLLAKRYLAHLLSGLIEPERIEPAVDEVVEKDLNSILVEPHGVAFEEKKRKLSNLLPESAIDALIANGYYQCLEEKVPLPGTPEAEAGDQEREIDEFFVEAAKIVIRHKEASVSMLQRRLDIGWARAGRIIDQLQQAGIVGPYQGSKSRKVLVESEEEMNNLLAGQAWFGAKYPGATGGAESGGR
jgi:S-DNA-T family DNA segregation ATPase FtsK/SpoIIIE